MSKVYNVVITEEDGTFVAVNPDTDVASQGETLELALANIHEALELYLEESNKNGKTGTTPQATFLTTITI